MSITSTNMSITPFRTPVKRLIPCLLVYMIIATGPSVCFAESAEDHSDDHTMSLQQASTQTEATLITENIYSAEGFGNTFLVVTEEGTVVVDTSMARNAAKHKQLLNQVDARDPEYIIVTHGHGDHIGGVSHWKAENTKVIMQEASTEFLHYQNRLKGFFKHRNAAQFGFELTEFDQTELAVENYNAKIPVDIAFGDKHSFKLGGLSFEVLATPSETHDALSVWIPERSAVFVGDLFYRSFPNIYTLRGTKPRWALDYVNSLEKVLALKAEILIPSHGAPIVGADNVKQALTLYRDAILYVHDAVVRGMNVGKSVDVLVDEISLPDKLQLPEIYGRVDWSVRGIYQGYAGWFDGNPSTMLGVDSLKSISELIELSGGVDKVTARAKALYERNRVEEALSLSDIVLAVDNNNRAAHKLKLDIFSQKLKNTSNFNEAGWLKYGIKTSKKALENQATE